jgi:CheY-like chemotaxis protein
VTPTPRNVEGRPHILIVDDEEDNRELLQIVLTHNGYFVTCAGDGLEALASIRDIAPDLVLLDLMMPGMDGYEVATEIKRNLATSHIVVILFSASNNDDVRTRAREAGALECFGKPMGSRELCDRLSVHLPAGAHGVTQWDA